MNVADGARAGRPGGEEGRLARRSAFNFVGLAAANAFQFGMVWVLARRLGQHDAGVFFEGFAAIRLLSVVASLGLDVTAVRYVAVHRAQGDHGGAGAAIRLSLALCTGLSLLATAITFAVAPALARAFGSSDLTPVLRIMVLALPFVVAQMVLIGATRGTGRMRAFVVVDQFLDGAFRLGAITVALVAGTGLYGAAWAFTIAAVLTTATASVAAWSIVREPLTGIGPRAGELLRFTGYQWGGALAGVGLLWADTLLLGLWRPPADVAVYSIVTRTVLFGMMFILPIGIAFQPVIARLYAIGDRERLASMYRFATKWSTLAGGPPLLFLAIFATPVILLLYPDPYARGAWAMALLALGQTVNAATGPCGHMVTMVGRSDLVLTNSLAALVINLVLNVALIPPYGMVGAGIAWGVSIVLWNLIRLYQAWSVLHMHPFGPWVPRSGLVLAVFCAAAAAMRLLLEGEPPLVQIVAGAAVATVAGVAAMMATGLVERDNLSLAGARGLLARDQAPSGSPPA
jgi:O-antigen/teichoic acid export membrane protein